MPYSHKKCRIQLILQVIFFSTAEIASGQLFFNGTDPGNTRWSQINTPHFRVIYPRNLEKQGQHVANGLEYNYLPGSRTLKTLPPKTPVIIHPFTTAPTSVTYIAPRRMAFFTTPPQDSYPQDWTDQLIIHEFRHAVQYSAINKGISKGVGWVLGEHGTFALFGLFIPMWLMEGDATVAETALHQTGRGRTPSFEMKLRAQFVEGKINRYEKAVYGSFRDFVPRKYEIGYQLTGWSRAYYGKDLWAEVMNNVARRPFLIFPFNSTLRKVTGLNKYNLYDTIATRMTRTWVDEDRLTDLSPFTRVNTMKKKFYSNYTLPAIRNDSTIIAVKSSPDFLSRVVSIDNKGNEKMLFRLGVNYYSETMSATDRNIYWSERVTDPRWLLRDYMVIKKYDFENRRIIQLTHRSRYFAPAASHDGDHLVAVEADPENNYRLIVLNSSTGAIEKKLSLPDNLLFIHPSWSPDDRLIVSVVMGKNGNSIAVNDLSTDRSEIVLPFTFLELKQPSFYNNYIIYTASYNGRDNIYALNRLSGEISSVTSSRFGARDASLSVKNNTITYSDYTANGYNIVKTSLDSTSWKKITVPSRNPFPLAEKLSEQEGFIFNPDSIPKTDYPSRPYRKVLNKFNLHSWGPFDANIQNLTPVPGITLFSQNLLETTVITGGYLYNRNEKSGRVFLNLSDDSRYIAFDLNIDYGNRAATGIYTLNDTIPQKWKELNVSPGIRLPLSWTSGPWNRKVTAAANMNFKFLKMDKEIPVRFDDNLLIAPAYSVIASNELKMAERDIYPRWSQEVKLNYAHTPFGKNSNSVFSGQLRFDLPGAFAHHGIRIYAGYQKKDSETYDFRDWLSFPRGYEEIGGREVSSFSAMYTMPLFYPDLRIKYLTYIKRVKASFFYDQARILDRFKPDSFSSAGIDLTFDLNLFNFIVPLELGVRSAWLIESKSLFTEFVYAISFGSIY